MQHSKFIGFLSRAIFLLVLLASAVGTLQADEPEKTDAAKDNEFFESKVRPVFVKHCYKCHSAEANQLEGGLRLDTREGVREGGDRGPAIVPGKPDESLLLTAISHTDPDLKMPPKSERLPASVLSDVEKWIRMGAPDPRKSDAKAPTLRGMDIEAGRRFWSFQKPVRHEIPATKNAAWAKRDLDHFILAKLESADLAPTADADPAVLLRRVHFDLIGLPPSPTEVRGFQERINRVGLDEALETEVDALLNSKQFGECWGRHWLDVARFAESSGKEANISFPYAWRYRDYVIDCVAADKPYNRFLVEQIAGDLLPYDNDAERARLLIATGFLALGPKNLDEANIFQFFADVVDEQIDTVTRAVLSNSVACARCHDHKFDPFAMEDYYALAGVFASTKTYFGTAVSPSNRIAGDPLLLPHVEGQLIFHKGIPATQVANLKAELAKLKKESDDGMAKVRKAMAAGEDASEIFTLRDALRIFWRTGAIEGQLESVDENGNPLPLAMGVLDSNRIHDARLLERGEVSRPTKSVPRGFPRVIQLDESLTIPARQSGRLEFAQWLTHPSNPLTARVMANRIWRYLCGSGIVRTVDNFGVTGELPSHPELLDHLALRFVDEGWSVKKLVREIVLSRTYRQASTFDERAFRIDPDNRLHWRADKRRLDAEAIRDAMLVVGEAFDQGRPEGSLVAKQIGDRPISLIGLDNRIPADLDGSLHRSVYLPVLRDRLPDVLDLFDFAEPSLVTGHRETTNVPMQALYLMNSPFVQARSKGFARRLLRVGDGNVAAAWEARVREAFMVCFGRDPDPQETSLAVAYLEKGMKLAGDNAELQNKVVVSYCQALLSTAEFRNLD